MKFMALERKIKFNFRANRESRELMCTCCLPTDNAFRCKSWFPQTTTTTTTASSFEGTVVRLLSKLPELNIRTTVRR